MNIQEIVNWTGWPVVTAVLFLISMILRQQIHTLKQQIDLQKEKNDFLNKKLEDCQQNSPDVVAERLKERNKRLLEEIEQIKLEEDQRMTSLKQELENTKQEATRLRSKLAEIDQKLKNVEEFPREGRVRIDVALSLLYLNPDQNSIYLLVRKLGDQPDIELAPYCIGIIYPGMHQTYLVIANRNGKVVGMVENHFGEMVYNRDYCETVMAILKVANMKPCSSVVDEAKIAILLENSTLIPLDNSLFFLKVPLEFRGDEILDVLRTSYNA